jgi:hypothetical protein
MKDLFSSISNMVFVIVWVVGIVIAKGFWSTFFAVILPLYSWYLVAEHFLIKYNLL